jgi:S-adenosylmethionine-diacylglycerol 3-amino-3-carboxypropyl transferase
MLAKDPQRVVAVDLNPSQLACLELRVAGFRCLDHGALLELIGSRSSDRREELYRECRPLLSPSAARFWDQQPVDIERGIGTAGKFERYFEMFRRRVLPLVHSRKKVARLLAGGSPDECRTFYDTEWNTWRWRLVFRVFFSRFVMGRAGRDPAFFKYVEGSVADRILERAEHALAELNPSENPYLRWILDGTHSGDALPFALRPENFDQIRNNLDCLEWHLTSVEGYLSSPEAPTFDRFNLSDIFEYMSEDNFHTLLRQIVDAGQQGSRLAYWNMLVPRSRPQFMSDELCSLDTLSSSLHQQDKAFFYNTFVAEEIR